MSMSGKSKASKKGPNLGNFGSGPSGTAAKPPMSSMYAPKSR